jgi:hypothetical protein
LNRLIVKQKIDCKANGIKERTSECRVLV